jgi:hypothetical protein
VEHFIDHASQLRIDTGDGFSGIAQRWMGVRDQVKHSNNREFGMIRSERLPNRFPSIVAQRGRFVNLDRSIGALRLAALGVVSLVSMGLSAISQDAATTSELYRQAMDKLGPESRIRWIDGGDMSLQRWMPGRSIELRGILVEWEPDKLVLVRRDANGPTTFPGDLAIGLEVGWKEEACAEVHQWFAEQQFENVIQKGQVALQLPSVPRWQRRILVAEMVQSACALGQWRVAGRIYDYLTQDSAPLLLQAVIPLPWSDELLTSGQGIRDSAAEWIKDEDPRMQLLGASWLLGSEQNGQAIEVLRRLSTNESVLVSNYAQAQLWRTAPPSEIRSTLFGQWVSLRDRMPISLQAGPTMLLAHRLDQAGDWELAVAEWLRIASLFGDRYHLRRQALDRAVAACRAAGAADDAEKIKARFSFESGSTR